MLRIFRANQVFLFFIGAFAFFPPLGKGPTNLSMGLALLLGLFILKKKHFQITAFLKQPLIKPLGYFFGLLLISLFFSTNRLESLVMYSHMVTYILPFIMFAALKSCYQRDIEIDTKRILQCYIAGSVVAALYAIVQFIQTKQLHVTGFYNNSAIFASFLEVALPLTVALFLNAINVKQRCQYFLAGIVCAVAFILTQARGPWLGAGVALILIGMLLREKVFIHKKTVIFCLLIILILVLALSPLYVERIKTILDPKWPSNYERLLIWQSTLKMIKDYPLTGVGLGQFIPIYNNKYLSPLSQDHYHFHAHNSFLMLAAESGIPVLIAFLYLLFQIFRRLITNTKAHPRGALVGILGVFVAITLSSLVDCFLWASYLARTLWLLVGLSIYGNRQVEE